MRQASSETVFVSRSLVSQVLLEHGAAHDAANDAGETPVDVTRRLDRKEIWGLFVGYWTLRLRLHAVGPRAARPTSARHVLRGDRYLARRVASYLVG